MTPDVNKKLLDVCKCVCNQVTAFGKLNNETLESFTTSSSFEEMMSAQKTEDFISAQLRLIAESNAYAMNYLHQSCSLMLKGQQDFLKQLTSFSSELSSQSFYTKSSKTGEGSKK